MTTQERFNNVIGWFKENAPVPEIELDFNNAYELLVAVVLAAQCTDKRVNIITPPFFERFPNPEKLAESSQEEIYEYIRSCSYPNNKAKHLYGMAQMLVKDFGGKVPENVDDLQKLPGVGRKSANAIASNAFEVAAIAVDTHVFRVSARIGLSIDAKTPRETEDQLMQYIPEEVMYKVNHWLILHGRYICIARKPKCEECGLRDYCLYYKNTVLPQEKHV
jgi:endonuclease-3